MQRKSLHWLFVLFVLLVAFFVIPMAAFGSELFFDGFESGSLDHMQSGIRWGASNNGASDDVSVADEKAYSGRYSLKFFFAGSPSMSDDAWAEQRIDLGSQFTELWIKYNIFFPENYYHRNVSPNNNKFIAVYRVPYTSPGFQVNFSTSADGNGNSSLNIHYYKNGSEQRPIACANNFISDRERGKWVELIMHIRVPSRSDSHDGIMQMWKNGELIVDVQNLDCYGGDGKNYFDEIYLLGWSNSGFNQDTCIYIDDLVLSDTPLASDTGQKPPPPRNLRTVE